MTAQAETNETDPTEPRDETELSVDPARTSEAEPPASPDPDEAPDVSDAADGQPVAGAAIATDAAKATKPEKAPWGKRVKPARVRASSTRVPRPPKPPKVPGPDVAATAREWAGAWQRRTRDWLDRPMTSFHLLMAVFFLLLGFGLLMVLSASSVVAYGRDGSSFGTFKKQLLFAGVGLIAFWATMRVKLSWLKAMSATGMIVSLGLLVVVLGMRPINGARSWISFGAISFQPSELAKFALVIWGAHVLASRRANLGSWRALLIPVLPVALLMGLLIMLEPDLGTTAALLVIVFALFFFAGASWKMFGILAACGVAGLAALAMSATYRMARVTSFLHPELEPQGSGLQLLQGLYGMADGGLFGVGLGQSRAKWAYLPHAESDFIFAIVGEELGFLGAALLIGLYITLSLVGLRIARRNVDPFIKLVAATSTAWLVGQAAINIFYVVGLLPVTGLTLPMISAGGTSLLVTMAIFGLLANFARREPQAMAALQNSGPGVISRFFGIGVPANNAAEEAERKAQERAERHQKRRWARSGSDPVGAGLSGNVAAGTGKMSARKPSRKERKAAEQRALQAAARQRPLDRRDESGRATDRRTAAVPTDRPGSRATGLSGPRSGSSPVRHPGTTSRPAPPLPRAARSQPDRPRPHSDRPHADRQRLDRLDPRATEQRRPHRPDESPERSAGLRGWLGFGAGGDGGPGTGELPGQRDRRHADSRRLDQPGRTRDDNNEPRRKSDDAAEPRRRPGRSPR